MKLLELLDTGPSAHTTLSRFAKELEAKGFEAEVKSSSKPGIINRSKLCIVVKGYGLRDVIKLYKPLFGWEDTSTYFVDSKHEKKFRTVQELVAVLKDKYKRLPKCLSYVPPVVKEDEGVVPIKRRILKFQQDLENLDYETVSNIIKTKGVSADGATTDRFVFVLAPVDDGHRFSTLYQKVVIIIDDQDSLMVPGRQPRSKVEQLVNVEIFHWGETYEELLKRDWTKHYPKRPIFIEDEAVTGRQESLDNAIAYLTK
jgi:hypothetical protein